METAGLHLRANASRENIASGNMSNLKILRGSFARQIFNSLASAKHGKKVNKELLSYSRLLSRSLATQSASAVDGKCLNSPWGEIQIGKETLTEHVFSDVEEWADAPAVVSTHISYFFFLKQLHGV